MSAIWLLHARCACVVGIDSYMGFEYSVVITLSSREFRVLLTILPTCLRLLRIFGFVGVAWCCGPTFIAQPHVLLTWGPFSGFLGLCSVCQGYGCVGIGHFDDSSADSSASLAQCCSCGGFFPSFAISAVLWGLLFFLGILAFIPMLHFWCCLFFFFFFFFLLRLSILFSLSSGG